MLKTKDIRIEATLGDVDVRIFGTVYPPTKADKDCPATDSSWEISAVLRKLCGVYALPMDDNDLHELDTSLEKLEDDLREMALREASDE